MVEIPDVLAIIPAWYEAGFFSQSLSGHALIAYTIAAARMTQNNSAVIVVSQDEGVARISKEYGATIFSFSAQPPESTAIGESLRDDLIRAILKAHNGPVEVVLWLDPFTPLRPKALLDQAVSLACLPGRDQAVQSMTALSTPGDKIWAAHEETDLELIQAPGKWYRQTNHVVAARVKTALDASRNPPRKAIPWAIDPQYAPDIQQPSGWEWAKWSLQQTHFDLVHPGHPPRPLPDKTELLVLDFDGVLTDNRVWVDEDGREQVAAYRSDSLGLAYLRQAGIDVIVISMETNPVVAARCRKMKIPVLQGINDKATTLAALLHERSINPGSVVYLGNDTNDVPCFPIVGCAAVVADAQTAALKEADLVLTRRGGYGAVRELCDRLIEKQKG